MVYISNKILLFNFLIVIKNYKKSLETWNVISKIICKVIIIITTYIYIYIAIISTYKYI